MEIRQSRSSGWICRCLGRDRGGLGELFPAGAGLHPPSPARAVQGGDETLIPPQGAAAEKADSASNPQRQPLAEGRATARLQPRSLLLASSETICSSNAPLRATNLWIRFGTVILLGLIRS